MLRYAHALNGFTGLHLTKLDVLGGLSQIKVCIEYKINGKLVERFPASAREMAKVMPVYTDLKGFEDLSPEAWAKVAKAGKTKGLAALPKAAKEYVKDVEELIGVPILSVSVGPGRDEIIWARS
jgi:adenylosuccinate synthase